ncbi:MAG: hypothetical protein C3F06_09835 [Candidatus Methanoperedenaceae archaeon]|nr:MAG: hypothetical protein C3F06_09835 [Candidatus Methanoperedenaceae archaeon]
MVNKKFVLGFTILVLIFGFVINVVGIKNNPSGDRGPVYSNSGEPRNFNITITDNTPINNTVKWYINGSKNGSTEYDVSSPNRTFTKNAGHYNITVISANASNASDTDFTEWLWIVTDSTSSETAPTITTDPSETPLDTSAYINFSVNQSNARTKVLYGTSVSTMILDEWDNDTHSNKVIHLIGLSHGTKYYYNVTAYNNTNMSLHTNSSTYSFTTLDATAPNISGVNEENLASTSINISFVVNQSNAKTNVKYGLNDSLLQSTVIGTSTKIKLSGLTEGTKYYYSVFAYNNTNQSFNSSSPIQNFTTKNLAPTISQDPSKTSTSTITVGESKILTVTIGSQGGNLTWHEENNATDPLRPKESVAPGAESTYNFSRDKKGTYKITANLTNPNGTIIAEFTIKNIPTTYSTGNRIWDGSKPDDFALAYTWTPQSFSGFYYNAKDDVGNENIKITLSSNTSRTIAEGKLVYSTSPQEVTFTHTAFGKYQVIGFMADKYFAGYTENTSSKNTRPSTDFDGISTVASNQLHKVLIDDDTKRTVSVGGTIPLKEGYVLKAKDIDLNARQMLLSLLKDGNEVDTSPLSADETYVYTKTVGGVESLPLIMVRFDNVFSGQEMQTAFLKGMFQISEDATIVQTGNQFGNMEVTTANKDGIKMENSGTIGLSKGTTATIMGDVKIIVADNDSVVRFALSVEKTGDFEVRSTVYRDEPNPIMEWTPYNFGMNLGKTSVGFFYDLDDGIGSEKLKLLDKVSGRSIPDKGLEYSTTTDEVKFTYSGFGKYKVIGFMADKYFAGYTENTGISSSGEINTRPSTDFAGISTLANNNLHKVLIDDDTKRTISVGGTLPLKEGYVLKATDIDLKGRSMLLSLLKDGSEVDTTPLSAGETYVYAKPVGGTDSLPLIMVRFESVFSGEEMQAAFLKGMFQISDSPTTVKSADQFGKMEVRSVTGDKITMSNDGSIGLDKNKNDVLMGNLRIKVADNADALRFYFAVDVTADMIENQLVIDAPSKIMAGDNINIKVTAGGKAVDNASVTLDTDIGTTDKDGMINYSIPKNLKNGTNTITATKTGYEKATKNIEIEKYVDYRLTIETPTKANQYEKINIKVLYNGTAMSDASVLFDNTSIGTTNSTGELNYRLETSGTHTITASKKSYITVSRDIDIIAPYSEFKALDIYITPNPVFTSDDFIIKSNITNAGTKLDTLPVELIINGTAVENQSVTLGAGENLEINFTRKEATPANITVEILGKSNLLVVQQKPTNYLLIAAIATGIGAVIIYVLTSKGLLSLELLKQKFGLLSQKFNLLFKK